MFCFFGCEACGILAPRPGTEPAPTALEVEVLTTGLPGTSPSTVSYAFASWMLSLFGPTAGAGGSSRKDNPNPLMLAWATARQPWVN